MDISFPSGASPATKTADLQQADDHDSINTKNDAWPTCRIMDTLGFLDKGTLQLGHGAHEGVQPVGAIGFFVCSNQGGAPPGEIRAGSF